MRETIYIYTKGQGWIPRLGPRVLSIQEIRVTWVQPGPSLGYELPPACLGPDWVIMKSCNLLQVGDVIPFSSHISVVNEIKDNWASVIAYNQSGEQLKRVDVRVSDNWGYVARPKD